MNLSVRFFKRLFLSILSSLIVIPVVLSICFCISASRAKNQVDRLQVQLRDAQEALAQAAYSEAQLSTMPLPMEMLPNTDISADAAQTLEQTTPLPYQTRYPSLYCDDFAPADWKLESNTIYLTFDGGVSNQTQTILDTLDQYGVKATFFVIAQGYAQAPAMLNEIVRRGHTLGIQSYTDRYSEIYESVESYLADFNAAYTLIEEVTGVKPSIFRFPGGSINSYNIGIYPQLIAEMTRRGFTYYDWDVVNNDTAPKTTAESAKQAVLSGVRGKTRAIVLMHDASSKPSTAKSLPGVIDALEKQGYSFAALTPRVEPIRFNYIK